MPESLISKSLLENENFCSYDKNDRDGNARENSAKLDKIAYLSLFRYLV